MEAENCLIIHLALVQPPMVPPAPKMHSAKAVFAITANAQMIAKSSVVLKVIMSAVLINVFLSKQLAANALKTRTAASDISVATVSAAQTNVKSALSVHIKHHATVIVIIAIIVHATKQPNVATICTATTILHGDKYAILKNSLILNAVKTMNVSTVYIVMVINVSKNLKTTMYAFV